MKKRAGIYALFMLVLLSCVLLSSCKTPPPNEQESKFTPCEIDVLKVGKADCIFINTGTNIVMIDTAEEENFPTIKSYMEKRGYNRIDTLILTHYDKDHIGGASQIIASYDVKNVIENRFVVNSIYYNTYHSMIEEKAINLVKAEKDFSFTYDSCKFTVNVPKKDAYKNMDNNSSLIVNLECGEQKLLFTGDALEDRISEFLFENEKEYNLIKLPHHGSYLANYSVFLDKTKPQYAVITDSNKNPPDEKTIDILNKKEIELFETKNGDIKITVNKKMILVSQ